MDPALTQRLLDALVGRPLVSNAFRGTLVEAMLADALKPEWTWMADGWGAYDFRGPGGIGLEAKQSAARQDWHSATSKPNRGRFDIAPRKGYWDEQGLWIDRPGRAAAIYVFAWHPVFDPELADHRDSAQWQFHVILAARLPDQKSIALSGICNLAQPCRINAVKAEVRKVLASF